MHKLIEVIETTRSKIDALRRRGLKETPTRTIVIDPILEALGWDVRDPDEVELEYPTIDNKSVDYALKLNKKCVLLIEAKALDDPLADVKAITQVVGYAANDGIVWCVLTNGIRWRVYRSTESCPAPDKLMFESSLDPRDTEGMSARQVAEKLWQFSREEMAKGTLDTLGEQVFTDGRVRKVLESFMQSPPRRLVELIRSELGDLEPGRIKQSLSRVWPGAGSPAISDGFSGTSKPNAPRSRPVRGLTGTRSDQRHGRAQRPPVDYGENHHIAGKPQEVVALYTAIDRLCHSLDPGGVTKRYLAKCIAYDAAKPSFCSVHLLQGGLRVWLKLRYSRLDHPPTFARDVSNVGHWGAGDLELGITSLSQMDEASALIRQSFEQSGR